MAIFNALPVAFPWYDKLEKQNRYRENALPVCDYKLITPRDALLPFQFYKTSNLQRPSAWTIRNVNTKVTVATLTPSLSQIVGKTVRGQDYFYYVPTVALTTTGGTLSLATGFYESLLTFPNGYIAYSEMFYVPPASFALAGQGTTKYIRLEWYNAAGDIPPIFYANTPVFKNIVFLDTFITASEPEIEQDGTKDGNDETIPTFQKALIRYRITDMLPDFLKLAIVLMEMHDTVNITTPGGLYSGNIEKMETNTAPDDTGALAVVDILFQHDVAMVKKGCNNNMALTTPGL